MRCFKCISWSEALIQVNNTDDGLLIDSYCYKLAKWTDHMFICSEYGASHDKVASILGYSPSLSLDNTEIKPSSEAMLVSMLAQLGGK